jgi:hypothetical protein
LAILAGLEYRFATSFCIPIGNLGQQVKGIRRIKKVGGGDVVLDIINTI